MLRVFFGNLPFGGVNGSGLGAYIGKTGFDSLTHAKSIVFSPADESIEVLFPPYSEDAPEKFAQLFQG
jgi:aldehyde dehydrogenase (NAD+)